MSAPNTLIEELEKRFGKVKRTGKGWLRIACPTCTERDSKKYKRYVSTSGYYTNCWICNKVLDVRDLVQGYYIANTNAVPKVEEAKPVDPRALVMPCHSSIPVNQLDHEHPAIQFLFKDHLFDLDRYYNEHGLVYVPVEGGKVFRSSAPYTTSAERLVFPVHFNNKFIGWQMRSIPGTFYGDRKDVIKYYHLFDKGSHVYNYDKAKKFEMVIVVEGIKKALKFDNAVATWGTGISDRQLRIIQEWPKIVMLLDAEDHNGTQERAKTFVEGFKAAGKQAINIDLRPYGVTSPDDLPSERLEQIVYNEWTNAYGE